MADDLAGGPELVVQLRPEDGQGVLVGGAGMQAVGDDEQEVLFFHPNAVQVLQDVLDGQLAVAGGLLAALDAVRHDKDHLAALAGQLLDGGHADGVVKAFPVGGLQPVLRDIVRVGDGDAGDELVGIVGQVGAHGAGAVFKLKMLHGGLLSGGGVYLPRYSRMMSRYSSG